MLAPGNANADELSRRRFWLHVSLAAFAMVLGSWLSSGTLAPYGMQVGDECHYRINIDHPHFEAPFKMLEGRPEAEWNDSVVLRRILHPILAYPWVKAFGFELGGLLFNVFSHVLLPEALAMSDRLLAMVGTVRTRASTPLFGFPVGRRRRSS